MAWLWHGSACGCRPGLGCLASQAREAASKRVLAGKVSPVEELKAQVAEAQALSANAVAQSEWRAAVSLNCVRHWVIRASNSSASGEVDIGRCLPLGGGSPVAAAGSPPAIARRNRKSRAGKP